MTEPTTTPLQPYNATADLLERNLAEGRGAKTYVIAPDREWSYEEISAMADCVGSGLLARGLQSGDRLLLSTADRVEFIIAFWGAIKAGLVPVPLAQGLSASNLDFIFRDSNAAAVLCDVGSVRDVLPAVENETSVFFAGDDPPDGTIPWQTLCSERSPLTVAPTRAEDIALWLYTSGTTGLPKAVMHRHSHLQAVPSALSAQVLKAGPDDVILSTSRMFFAYGLGNSVYLPAAAGASVVINPGPVIPAGIQGLLEKHEPTLLFAVPAFLAGYSKLTNAKLPSSTRCVLTAGEALPVPLLESFRDRFGIPPLDGLGATEAMHHFTCNHPDDVTPGSVGRALEGYEVRALDRDQEPVPEGERGELWVRGPTVFAGYWRRPELTQRAFDGEWMRTGDVVRIEDGRVFHEGRLDDLLKLGGIWVSPREIEDVLRRHPAVNDAAVVTVDEDTGIPLLKAYVVSEHEEKALTRELQKMARTELASFKVPRLFEVVAELPRTPSGKVKRFVLREGNEGG